MAATEKERERETIRRERIHTLVTLGVANVQETVWFWGETRHDLASGCGQVLLHELGVDLRVFARLVEPEHLALKEARNRVSW